eukprot:11404-Prymnesium_polylepis.1
MDEHFDRRARPTAARSSATVRSCSAADGPSAISSRFAPVPAWRQRIERETCATRQARAATVCDAKIRPGRDFGRKSRSVA